MLYNLSHIYLKNTLYLHKMSSSLDNPIKIILINLI